MSESESELRERERDRGGTQGTRVRRQGEKVELVEMSV